MSEGFQWTSMVVANSSASSLYSCVPVLDGIAASGGGTAVVLLLAAFGCFWVLMPVYVCSWLRVPAYGRMPPGNQKHALEDLQRTCQHFCSRVF